CALWPNARCSYQAISFRAHLKRISTMKTAAIALLAATLIVIGLPRRAAATCTSLICQIEALQSSVTTLKGQVSTLQGRVSALESDNTTLMGEVSTLQSSN